MPGNAPEPQVRTGRQGIEGASMFRLRIGRRRTGPASVPIGQGATPPTPSRETGPERIKEKSVRVSTSPTSGDRSPIREQVALHAYHLWLARGRPAGTGLEDWLEAERQLAATT
jgi:hypothetical protein